MIENISLVDLRSEYKSLQSEIDTAIKTVLESGYFIGGPEVKNFETSLSEFLGANVKSCANGTDALQLALMALEVKPSDEIIVPAFTFVSPAEAALFLGCKPIFIDVDDQNYGIDVDQIEKAITAKTKAIIVVHLFGQSVDMERVMKIAQKHNIYVIEDVAQAFGAKLNNQYLGTIGDIGCTSFFPSKNLGCYGDGGAVYTKNSDLLNRVKQFASHGMNGKKFYHESVGINSRLDAIQAAILNVKLKHLPQFIEKRIAIAHRYNEAFDSIKEIITPHTSEGMVHSYHQYVVVVKNNKRNDLMAFLKEKNISTGVYYPVALTSLPPYSNGKSFPVAENLANSTLALPVHPYLTTKQQDKVIRCVTEFFNG